MGSILIVDDEEPIRAVLEQLLIEVGYQVRLAIHGAQALELVERERPDLVLCDVMMPVLNGRELCRRLKASEDTKGIPIILMTAAGEKAADGAGADAFLAKPFDLEGVEALVLRFVPVQP